MSELKYKVIKPFVDETGKLWTINEEPTIHNIKVSMQSSLKEFEFIEPYTPEPKHWRANKYTTYYYVCTMLDTIEAHADQQLEFDNNKYNSGNYFKSQTTAELVAKAQKLFFEWLHDKEAGWLVNRLGLERDTNFLIAMEEARKAVLEDDSNE